MAGLTELEEDGDAIDAHRDREVRPGVTVEVSGDDGNRVTARRHADVRGEPKRPAPSPWGMETLLLGPLATARSGIESLLKRPTVTDSGPRPAGKVPTSVKLPAPSPKKHGDIVGPLFVTTRSGKGISVEISRGDRGGSVPHQVGHARDQRLESESRSMTVTVSSPRVGHDEVDARRG